MKVTSISRRGFFTAAGVAAGAVAMSGLAGCAPTASDAADKQEAGAIAGNDPSWIGADPEILDEEVVEKIECEVLIVGAGNAGMAAAATAANAGLDFVVCEKGHVVAESRHWLGAVNSKYTKEAGFEVDEGKLLNELSRYASGRCDQSVWRTWIRESGETVEFIVDAVAESGMKVFFDGEGHDLPSGGTDFYCPPVQHMVYDDGAPGPIPVAGDMSKVQRNKALENYINSRGYSVNYGYELVSLVVEQGRVSGAYFAVDGGYALVSASKGVLLATGGYAANVEMIRSLNPTMPNSVTTSTFSLNCDGSGIRAALRAGAIMDDNPSSMVFDRGIVKPGVDAGWDEDGIFPVSCMAPDAMLPGSQPFLKVNRFGKRFMNESAPYDWAVNAASKQPGKVFCTIMDSNAGADAARFATLGCSKVGTFLLNQGPVEAVFESQVSSGALIVANTLEELAAGIGVPEDEFLKTVERYNQLFDAQNDEDFGKEPHRLSAIRQAPYYGFWIGGELFATLDGLQINSDMQVLAEDHLPIEGLYAAGDCSGSVFCDNYPEYIVGCACGRTVTFGRHAVLHMAGLI